MRKGPDLFRANLSPVHFPKLKNAIQKGIALIKGGHEREQLYYLLGSANPTVPLAERLDWLEKIMFWVRTASPYQHGFDPETGQLHNVRIRFLMHLLDGHPDWKQNAGAILRSLIRETSALSLFSQVGLSQQKGFIAEASDRILIRVLPRPAQERELSELFLRIFEKEHDAVWVNHIPAVLMRQVLDLITHGDSDGALFSGWREDLKDSVLILGARVADLGTLPEILARLPIVKISSLPFLTLSQKLVTLINSKPQADGSWFSAHECLVEVAACRNQIKEVYAALERSGVSVALVYTIENLLSALGRIELLVRLLMPPSDHTPEWITTFMATLVRERLAKSTLRNLVRTNLHLLSSKIVERAGASGEHYIARTRPEYFHMLKAGTGGGAIMIVTTLAKFFIGGLGLALFFEGLFFSFNYSLSFVVLQLCGFTLATKQPSATASALAGKLKDLDHEGEVRGFVDEACRMTRTQFAALAGNLILIFPLATLLDLVVYYTTRHHLLSEATSHHVLASLNPLTSFTIPMAALTGVWLWMSSLAAGWLENWFVFRQIPEALSTQKRLVQVFGEKGARKIGNWALNNATLLGGNISLGFLMGFTSIFGKFVGLPLDVRHVTLSSVSLTLATCSLFNHPINVTDLAAACLGVVFVGFLNFAVGYSLALAVAARARQVETGSLRRLLRALRVRFRNRPAEFFFPPKAKTVEADL
jgi:site-specific recombinase